MQGHMQNHIIIYNTYNTHIQCRQTQNTNQAYVGMYAVLGHNNITCADTKY